MSTEITTKRGREAKGVVPAEAVGVGTGELPGQDLVGTSNP